LNGIRNTLTWEFGILDKKLSFELRCSLFYVRVQVRAAANNEPRTKTKN